MSVEQTETTNGRQKLEAAVTKLGKAYEELVRVVERFGKEIKREDLDKVFLFLNQVQAGSRNKALLSLSTAIAATGGFSLDTFEPESQSTLIDLTDQQPPNIQDGAQGSRFHELQQHGGRLAGKPKKKIAEPEDDGFLED